MKDSGKFSLLVESAGTVLLCKVSHQYRKKINSRRNSVFADFYILEQVFLIFIQC